MIDELSGPPRALGDRFVKRASALWAGAFLAAAACASSGRPPEASGPSGASSTSGASNSSLTAAGSTSAGATNSATTGSSSGNAGTGASSTSGSPVLIGAIRWDAWYSTISYPSDGGTYVACDPTLYTEFDDRRPFYGWEAVSDSAVDSGIPTAADQLIMDREIDYAVRGKIDYWAFGYYSAVYPPNRGLSTALAAYRASAKTEKPKFALIAGSDYFVNPGWNPRARVQEFVGDFRDPFYLKVAGNRPVIFIGDPAHLDDGTGNWNSGDGGIRQYFIDTAVDAGLGPPYLVSILGGTAATTLAAGFDGISSYGTGFTNADSGVFTNGHLSFAQFAVNAPADDVALLEVGDGGRGGLTLVPALQAVGDHRPRNYGSLLDIADSADAQLDFWADIPTFGQWTNEVSFFQAQAVDGGYPTPDPPLLLIYAWNELDEGGQGIVPTGERGSDFLDGIAAAKAGGATDYYDLLNDSNLAITYLGDWTYFGPEQASVPVSTNAHPTQHGFVGNDEHQTSTVGATATLSWPKVVGFDVFGATAPGRGVMAISCDDGGAVLVDTGASPDAGLQSRVLLGQCTFGHRGRHTVQIANDNGLPIGIDAIRAKVSTGPSPAPLPPTVAVQAYQDQFALSWLSLPGATGYNVYVSDAGIDGPWTPLAHDVSGPYDVAADGVAGSWLTVTAVIDGAETPLSNPVPVDPTPNFATGAIASASTSSSGDGGATAPSNAIDGQLGTAWVGTGFSDWLEVDFAGPTRVGRFDVAEDLTVGITSAYKIQFCNVAPCSASSVWQDAYLGATLGPRATWTFRPVLANAMRLQFVSGTGAPGVRELGFYL